MSKPGGEVRVALQAINAWFERQKRVLPWRDDPTLYRVWISEIMLQQTQVITVVPFFERFLARFPDVSSLASAPLDEVLLAWAGLGYYSRARNLHRGAELIVERGFPRDREGWLEIPGVGDYTAGAILSIALDQPEAILDGNVERVLSRIRRMGRQRGDAAYKARLWRLSRFLVERAAGLGVPPRNLNQALMELGALICTPRKPKCTACPWSEICRARQRGEMEAYPPRKPPKQWIAVEETVDCFVDDRERILVRQRAPGEWRAGLWDLPVRDQAPVRSGDAKQIGEVTTKHVVTRHKISRTTRVWRVRAELSDESQWRAAENGGLLFEAPQLEGRWLWIDPSAPQVAVGSAFKRTMGAIRDRFPEAAL